MQNSEVLQTVTSEEVQLEGVKMGMVSPLNSMELEKQFASDLPNAKGKHLDSIFKSHQVTAPPKSKYFQNARNTMDKYWKQYKDGKIDVNTALRQADEEVNKFVAAQ